MSFYLEQHKICAYITTQIVLFICEASTSPFYQWWVLKSPQDIWQCVSKHVPPQTFFWLFLPNVCSCHAIWNIPKAQNYCLYAIEMVQILIQRYPCIVDHGSITSQILRERACWLDNKENSRHNPESPKWCFKLLDNFSLVYCFKFF